MSVNDGGSALDAIQNILSVNEKQDTEVNNNNNNKLYYQIEKGKKVKLYNIIY